MLGPEVLVMDEPTAALDLLMQRSIIALLDDLQRQYNLTIVFITHDLELVADLADRLAVMYAFNFVEVGSSEQIILDSNHPYTRALINSTPNLDTTVDMMEPIAGESLDPVDVPEGCSYHPAVRYGGGLRGGVPAARRGRTGPPVRLLLLGGRRRRYPTQPRGGETK